MIGLGLSIHRTAPAVRAPVNKLINSAFLGAVSGTPGTTPTSWSRFDSGGTLTVQAAPTGGNALLIATTAVRQFYFQNVTMAPNETRTWSVLADINSGSIVASNIILSQTLPTGATTTTRVNGAPADATLLTGSGLVLEFTVTTGTTGGTTAIRMGCRASSNVTAGVRLYAPACELGASRGMYLLT